MNRDAAVLVRASAALQAAAYAAGELPPRFERLARPNPESGRDTDNEHHKVFDDKNGKIGFHVFISLIFARTENRKPPAILTDPSFLPRLPVGMLVEIASNGDRCRHGVKHAENADSYHQPLQLLHLGSAFVFDDSSYVEQGDETGDQESGTDAQK